MSSVLHLKSPHLCLISVLLYSIIFEILRPTSSRFSFLTQPVATLVSRNLQFSLSFSDPSESALHSKCKCDQPQEVCICCQNEVEPFNRRPARGPSSSSLSSDPTSTSNREKKRKVNHQVESLPKDLWSNLDSDAFVGAGPTRKSASQPSFTSRESKDPRTGSSCCSSSTPLNRATTSSTSTSNQRQIFDPAFNIHPSTVAPYLSNSFDHQAPSSSSHLFLLPDPATSNDQNHSKTSFTSDTQFSEDPILSNSLEAQDLNPDPLERMISEARSEMDCNCGQRCQCPGCFGLKKDKGNEEGIGGVHEVDRRKGDVEKQVEEGGLKLDRTLSKSWAKESTAENGLSGLSSTFTSRSKQAEVAKSKFQRETESISGDGKQTSKPLSSTSSESQSISQAHDDHKSKSGEFFDNCPTLCISCKGCDLSLENPWFGIPEVDDFMSRSRESQVALYF